MRYAGILPDHIFDLYVAELMALHHFTFDSACLLGWTLLGAMRAREVALLHPRERGLGN